MIDYSISMTVERILDAQNLIFETFQPAKQVTSKSTQVSPFYIQPDINEDWVQDWNHVIFPSFCQSLKRQTTIGV